jgi:NTE family protein
MVNTMTLKGTTIPLSGPPVSVGGRKVSPNGLADGVFEGGGVKGIAHVGALAYAEEIGLRFVNVAGTSAGAIIAALIAANYRALEIVQIMNEIHFQDFKDEPKPLGYIPLLGEVAHLFLDKGIYQGDYFERTMERYLAQQGVHTFRQLVITEEPPDSKYRYRLRVVASDISRGKMLVLPQDIRDFGIAPENLSVAKAIRMSMSIPIFFEPVVVKFTSEGTRREAYIVDGGALSNYPVHLFDELGVPSWPTFGFKLQETAVPKPAAIRGPVSLCLATYNAMFSAMDKRYIEETNWDRTIPIPTPGVSSIDFDLGKEKQQALYLSGYEAARKFFEEWWDWDKHVKAREAGLSMEQV